MPTPDAVRRWIRENRLDGEKKSNREGFLVSETALQKFLEASPKYAALAAASVTAGSMIGTVAYTVTNMVGALTGQKKEKNNELVRDDIVTFLWMR